MTDQNSNGQSELDHATPELESHHGYQYAFSLADVVGAVSSGLDRSVTPAEVRALELGSEYAWGVDDFGQAMWSHNIVVEEIDWPQIRRAHKQTKNRPTIFLALNNQTAWMISYDESVGLLKAVDVFTKDPQLEDLGEFFTNEDWVFLSCSIQVPTALAVLPGVESHWFWSTIWTNRDLYLQSGLAALLTNVFALGVSMFSMIVYNRVIPSNAMDSLFVLVSGMGILMVVDYATRSVRNHFLSVAGVDSDLTLADKLFAQVLDLQYKSRQGTVGALANTLKEFEHIREFFASATLVSLIDVPFAVVFLLAIGLVGGWMVVPVILGILVLLSVTLYIQPKMKALAKHSFEDGQTKHSVMVESLTGLETLKLLGAGGLMRRRLRSVLERQADISEQTKQGTHLSSNVAQTVQQLVQMSVVALGAILVADGQFGFGAIIAATILSGKALAPFAQFSQLLVRINQIGTSYSALAELMKQPLEHPPGKAFMPRNRFSGSIEFKDVTFTYPGQQSPVLDCVSFKVQPGERVAILGHVGSGKTTIERLIAGLYEPDSGKIFIDGIDIRQIAPADLRENLGISTQDVWLMSTSIEQNISLGALDISPEKVLWAGDIAGVSDFANRHPDGYRLMLKERGESLSGGQRQAISLARAIVRQPPILIFDEPTSSMDARSEQLFVQRLKNADLSATTLVITHRTSLLSLVDRVIIMEYGKIAGMGSTADFQAAQTDKDAAAQIVKNAVHAQHGRAAPISARPKPAANSQNTEQSPEGKS